MEYEKFENTIVARIDKGEEIVGKIQEIATREGIKLASVNAIGATNDFTVGVLDVSAKKFKSNNFSGNYEIVSLSGTITTFKGDFYCHLHMSAGDESGNVFGGHLVRAIVSATCEMIIAVINGNADRRFDMETGLNLLEFGKPKA